MIAFLLSVLLLAAILSGLVVFGLKRIKIVHENFLTCSRVLQAPIEYPVFNWPFYAVIGGFFHDRKLVLRYFGFLNTPEPEIFIVPKARIHDMNITPTDITFFVNGKLFYRGKGQAKAVPLGDFALRILNEDEIKRIFEELFFAAKMIETT